MNKTEIIEGIYAALLADDNDLGLKILDAFGKVKWNEAQSDAAKRSRERKANSKLLSGNGFPISITQYKP